MKKWTTRVVAVLLLLLAVSIAIGAELSNDRYIQITTTAGQTALTYDFKLESEDDIGIKRTRSGSVSTLVKGTDFTVAGVGNSSGGTVTLTAPALASDVYTLYGDEPYVRETDFADLGLIRASEIDRQGDELIRLSQQTRRDLDRIPVQIGIEDTSSVYTLPTPATRASKVLGFDGAGAFALIAPTTVSLPSSFAATGGSTLRTQADRALDLGVNPLDYGAVGDGTTDDYAALVAAEAYAESIGSFIYVPDGKTFAFNGRWDVNVSIIGYGSFKILNTWTSADGARNLDTIVLDGDDLILRGFTVDGDFKASGIIAVNADRLYVDGIRTVDTLTDGIYVSNSTDVWVTNSHFRNIHYVNENTDPDYDSGHGHTSNVGADGIAYRNVLRGRIIGNTIQAPHRIGIVIEQENPNDSRDFIVAENHIYDVTCETLANGQANACIWAENTGSGRIVNNACTRFARDVVSSPTNTTCEQTGPSGIRVGNGSDDPTEILIAGNLLRATEPADGLKNHIDIAVGTDNSGTKNITIRDNTIQNAMGQSMSVTCSSGTWNDVVIENNKWDVWTAASSSQFMIGLTSSTSCHIEQIRIAGNKSRSVTRTGYPDAGDIFIEDTVTIGRMEVSDLDGWMFAATGPPEDFDEFIFKDSTIYYGTSTTTHVVMGAKTNVAQNVFFTRNPVSGATGDSIGHAATGTAQTVRTLMRNCRSDGEMAFGGGVATDHDFHLTIEGHEMTGGTVEFQFNPNASHYGILQVTGGLFKGWDPTNGAFRLGFNRTGNRAAIFRGATFMKDSGGGTGAPIQDAAQANESHFIVHGNAHQGATLWNTGIIGTADQDTDNEASFAVD